MAVRTLDKKTGAGSLFGLAVVGNGIYYVDDGDNTVKLLRRERRRGGRSSGAQPVKPRRRRGAWA